MSGATLDFDINQVPFSRRGAWINVSPVTALHRRSDDLHLVSHQTGMHAVLSLVPVVQGSRVATEIRATPAKLTWTSGSGTIEAVFEATDSVRFRGRGLDLRIADASIALTPFTGTYLFEDPVDRSYVFTSYESGRRYRLTCPSGVLIAEGSEALREHQRSVVATGPDDWEIVVEEFETGRPAYVAARSFDEVHGAVQLEFTTYLDQVAEWRTDDTPAAELAAYVLWSATVRAQGFLTRESILMSKHWMDKVWSWDHCFNALALAESDLDAALAQFLIPFDLQDASGALPDSVAHSEVLYNFVKPPIHGWALREIRRRAGTSPGSDQLADLYAHLERWTRFWLDIRRSPGRALPYYQHGNDSGWDNASTFDYDRVIEAPDLAAFLIIQLDVLAELAHELGNGTGQQWLDERDQLSSALLRELWNGETFVARGALNNRPSKTTGLLGLLPVLISDRLPAEMGDRLAQQIRAHLTDFGLATELPTSVDYEGDGYWRGPIWAPSTFLVEDGLRRGGHTDLADEVSLSFRRLCERSGFAENFDALSGQGLRDHAYTWTASCYLLLARDSRRRQSS